MKEIKFSEILDSAKVVKPFEERKEKILEKLSSLEAVKEEVLQAKIRLLKRDEDEAIIKGGDDLIFSIREQVEEVQKEIRDRAEEIRNLNNELLQIPEEIKQAAMVALNKAFPEIKQIVHSKWNDAFTAAEKAWSTLEEYAQKTGVRLFDFSHHNSLGPAQNKEMMKRLEEWVEI